MVKEQVIHSWASIRLRACQRNSRASTSTTNCQLYLISSVSRDGYQMSPQFHPSLLILLICEKSQPKSHGISSTLITFVPAVKVYDTHLQKLYRLAIAIFLHPTRGSNVQHACLPLSQKMSPITRMRIREWERRGRRDRFSNLQV